MDWWKVRSTWCYHCSCKLITLKIYNSCSYIIVIKLHMYVISHMLSCIHYNSCNLSNNIHTHRNTFSYNELQVVIVTEKPSCKSPHFVIVPFLLGVIPLTIFQPPPYKVSIMFRLVILTTSCTMPSFGFLNELIDNAKSSLSNTNSLYPFGT